jgi:hypothetical protein
MRGAITAVAVVASMLLAGCSGSSAQPFGTPYPVAPLKATAVRSHPVAVQRPKSPDLSFPSMRWDLVLRAAVLPAGCTTGGGPSLLLTGSEGAQATSPRLDCTAPRRYWVKSVVKVAVNTPDGNWVYLTPVQPSAAALNRAAARHSEITACTPGELLEPVASFVLMSPDGTLVRYKLVGPPARCR